MTRQIPLAAWERVLVFAPHPDDETLATGGLLQHAREVGSAIRTVFITDGDNNPWPQRALERRWRIQQADRSRWGARRRTEALAALATLGVPPEGAMFLGYPDQGLTQLLFSREEKVSQAIASLVAEWRPSLLIVPSARDCHPDHSAIALLVRRALTRLGAACPPFMELGYLVHGQSDSCASFQLPLSPEQQARKRDAILCHTTQLVLSRRRFLAFAEETEQFFFSTAPTVVDARHSVCTVGVEGSSLRLEIVARSRLEMFLPSTLYLIGNDPATDGIRYIVELPKKSGMVRVCDAISGSVITRAEFDGDWRRGELLLPLAVLPHGHSVFVKVTHRHSFFDVAGWREIVVPQTPLAVTTASEMPSHRVVREPVTCCVIPCYNVADLCEEVVRDAAMHVDYVVAVNDGSTDDTGQTLEHIAQESNGRVRVIQIPHNRGKGAALLAAFRYALAELPFDVLITCDGDRQHRPADIPRLVQAWQKKKATLVIGERQAFEQMPLRSRLGNTITSAILRRLYSASPRDTQSGQRALDRRFVAEVVRSITGRRYETELEILLLALEQQRHVCTAPIPTIYLPGNRSSHYRPILDSLRIYRTFIRRYLTRRWYEHLAETSPGQPALLQTEGEMAKEDESTERSRATDSFLLQARTASAPPINHSL